MKDHANAEAQAQLVTRLMAREQRAMQTLLRDYGSTIKSVVYQYLGTLKAYREECIDDVLLKIWTNIAQFDASRSSLRSWIAGICRYQAIDFRRRHLHELQEMYLEDVQTQPSDPAAQHAISAFSDETERILSALAPQDRALLISLYADGEATDTLAQQLALSQSGVYKRAERAKRKLRGRFPEKIVPEGEHS